MAFYRPGDPRWNRTIQHIAENLEHANESAQENIYGFTQRYIDPCFASITRCVHACTAPCFPAHADRRRLRGRARGREEASFDFYDDWDQDEGDGLLGWGSDSLDRLFGPPSTYGTVAQPGRARAMSYGQRSRDPRYDAVRRKSTVLARDGGADPTIIPSSSYFGFLGRLPFRIGGKGLRYKPSAADLTDHPGASRPTFDEGQPLMEDSDEDAPTRCEHKGHRRQRSNTHASGHTTDSLSSRGDIFPSDDELEDAVPLDDEFTISLERRSTGPWTDDANSSNKARSSKSKRPAASRLSTRTASSRNTRESGRSAHGQGTPQHFADATDEIPTMDDLQKEEERLRMDEEAEVHRKRQEALQLAVQRGLALEQPPTPTAKSAAARSPPPQPMATVHATVSPLVRSPASEMGPLLDFPSFVDAQTMPDSSSFHVDDSDFSSMAPTPNRPLSLKDQPREMPQENADFIPARLPHFGPG